MSKQQSTPNQAEEVDLLPPVWEAPVLKKGLVTSNTLNGGGSVSDGSAPS